MKNNDPAIPGLRRPTAREHGWICPQLSGEYSSSPGNLLGKAFLCFGIFLLVTAAAGALLGFGEPVGAIMCLILGGLFVFLYRVSVKSAEEQRLCLTALRQGNYLVAPAFSRKIGTCRGEGLSKGLIHVCLPNGELLEDGIRVPYSSVSPYLKQNIHRVPVLLIRIPGYSDTLALPVPCGEQAQYGAMSAEPIPGMRRPTPREHAWIAAQWSAEISQTIKEPWGKTPVFVGIILIVLAMGMAFLGRRGLLFAVCLAVLGILYLVYYRHGERSTKKQDALLAAFEQGNYTVAPAMSTKIEVCQSGKRTAGKIYACLPNGAVLEEGIPVPYSSVSPYLKQNIHRIPILLIRIPGYPAVLALPTPCNERM